MPEICDTCPKRSGCRWYELGIFERIEVRNGQAYCPDRSRRKNIV